MKVEGSYYVEASPGAVWDGLMSPELLAQCIPGCRQMDETGDGEYAVKLKVGVGAVSGSYTGKVRIHDVEAPRRFRLTAEGKRPGTSVSGTGLITITPEGDGARLDVVGEAAVTGVIARVGQRLIGSAARLMMGQFFGAAKQALESSA